MGHHHLAWDHEPLDLASSRRDSARVKPRIVPALLELGSSLAARVGSEDTHTISFSHAAAEALRALPFSSVSVDDLIHECLTASEFPRQRRSDDGFGQPSITVFRCDHFTVDLLFWDTATTGIHEHQFAGAFVLLAGSSLHTCFSFFEGEVVSPSMILGSLRPQGTEVLRVGDVRRIPPNADLIHSLYHLDAPSITLAVRSLSAGESRPEYEYLPPCVALDPAARDDAKTIRRRLLALSARYSDEALVRHMAGSLANTDLHGAFLVLTQANVCLGSTPEFKELVDVARRIHGPLIEQLLPVVRESGRRQFIAAARTLVLDPELRLFLALLLNLPDIELISHALRQVRPRQEPVDFVIDRVWELAGYREFGFSLDPVGEQVLRSLPWPSSEPQRRGGNCDRDRGQMSAAAHELAQSPFLRPLFNVTGGVYGLTRRYSM